MNGLEQYFEADQTRLSDDGYVPALLELMQRLGMMTDAQLEGVQLKCLELLARQTEIFSGGDSSVLEETAQSLLESVLYTVGAHLKTLPNSAAAAELVALSADELFLRGRRRVDAKLHAARHLFDLAQSVRLETDNLAYNATMDEGIAMFFKEYNPHFAAHETPGMIDYPLCLPEEGLTGADYMLKYVESLYLENMFVSHFTDVRALLCGYDAGYADLLINIYEIVLQSALGCVLTGTDPMQLTAPSGRVRLLGRTLAQGGQEQALSMVAKAGEQLIQMLAVPEGPMQEYIEKSLPKIAGELYRAAQEGTMERALWQKKYPERDQKIHFSYGEKMPDGEYRYLVSELLECRFSDDRILLVRQKVSSLDDLTEVLFDAMFTEKEIGAVLRGLELIELAALYKRYCAEPEAGGEREDTLRRCILRFLEKRPPGGREKVEALAGMLDEE